MKLKWFRPNFSAGALLKCALVLVSLLSLVLVVLPGGTTADTSPIPSYGNNIAYLGSYKGNVEADEQYLTSDIEQVGERGDNTTNSEWWHMFPHGSSQAGPEVKIMYFYQQPATDDLLYFDTTKDVEIVVHADLPDSLVNLTAEMQYGRDEGHNTLFGRDVDLNEDEDDYYYFNIRINEEVLENRVSLVLYFYFDLDIGEDFEGTVYTEGSSYCTYPLLEPPEGAVEDDDISVDDDVDDDVSSDDDVEDDDIAGEEEEEEEEDEEETHTVDDVQENEQESPGFGAVGLVLGTIVVLFGMRRRRRKK